MTNLAAECGYKGTVAGTRKTTPGQTDLGSLTLQSHVFQDFGLSKSMG